MIFEGKIWKSKTSSFWLAEVPELDIATQAKNKNEIPDMLSEAIRLLTDKENFEVKVELHNNRVFVEPNDPKQLFALALKRQRLNKQIQKNLIMNNNVCKLSSHITNQDTLKSIKNIEEGKNLFSADSFEEILKRAGIK